MEIDELVKAINKRDEAKRKAQEAARKKKQPLTRGGQYMIPLPPPIGTIVGLFLKAGKAVFSHLPRLFKQGKKATEKLKRVETKLGDIEGVKDNIQTKPEEEKLSVKDVQQEIKKEEGSESAESKESKKLSEEMNIRAMARAAHSNLLRTLAGNIETTKLALAPEGETEKIVAQLKGKEGEPESALAALSNTGKILSNQVQLGEAIQANNLAVAELAKTTADSDSADLLADRMDQMQADIKSHMDAAQTANMDASAEAEAKNKTLMDGIASGMKNSMEFMKSMPDKMDKAAAFKDMLKDVVASYVEEASFIFNGIKMLLEKIPVFKWIKKGLGAITGVVTKHVWPAMKRMGAAIKGFPKLVWQKMKDAGVWIKNKIFTPIKEKLIKPIWNKVIKPVAKIGMTLAKFYPPITAIILAVKGIKALMKFFGKSKEQKEEEKKAKEAKKNAKKEAKAAKKAEKAAKQAASKANQDSTNEEAEATQEDAEKSKKEDAELPDQDALAKEGGVDVGDVDTDGVSEPSQVKDAEEEGAMDGVKSSGGSASAKGSADAEDSEGEDAEAEEGEEEVEEGEVEESEAEESDAVSDYNDNEDASDAEAEQEQMLAQERMAAQMASGGGNETTQNVNIVQHTKDDPTTTYDDYMGG